MYQLLLQISLHKMYAALHLTAQFVYQLIYPLISTKFSHQLYQQANKVAVDLVFLLVLVATRSLVSSISGFLFCFLFLNVLNQERCINLSFPRHQIFNLSQRVFMILHQSKVGLEVPFQTILEECYAKKFCRPSIVYSHSTPVFGLTTVNLCCSFGIVS